MGLCAITLGSPAALSTVDQGAPAPAAISASPALDGLVGPRATIVDGLCGSDKLAARLLRCPRISRRAGARMRVIWEWLRSWSSQQQLDHAKHSPGAASSAIDAEAEVGVGADVCG